MGGSSARLGTVSGLVTLEGGKTSGPRPVPFAWVDVRGSTTRQLSAGADGRFQVRLPAGTYTVVAMLFDGRTRGPFRRVRVESGKTVRIRLPGYVM